MTVAIVAGLLGGFIGFCVGVAAGVFVVLGTLSLQSLEERSKEGYEE